MNSVQLKFNSSDSIKEQFNLINNTVTKLQDCYKREKAEKTTRFACIAFCIMLVNAILDFLRSMQASGMLISAMAFVTSLLIIFSAAGYKKYITPVVVFIINIFLLALSFIEGLRSGSFMQILTLLFTLSYLTTAKKITKTENSVYFFFTICSFCACIIFSSQTNTFQHISDALYHQMFIYNCISAVLVCGIFAGVNANAEKRYRIAFAEEKIKAELLENTLNKQNLHLQEIAYTGSHVVRKPLANILALTEMLNEELNNNLHITNIISHLDTSSKCLDEAIKEIVAKTNHSNRYPEIFLNE